MSLSISGINNKTAFAARKVLKPQTQVAFGSTAQAAKVAGEVGGSLVKVAKPKLTVLKELLLTKGIDLFRKAKFVISKFFKPVIDILKKSHEKIYNIMHKGLSKADSKGIITGLEKVAKAAK